MKERLRSEHQFFLISSSLAFLGLIATGAFPSWIRKKVREEQDYTCAYCHQHDDHLEVHHVKPKSLGGRDTVDNSIGLCGPEVNDCHEVVDRLALDYGILWSDNLVQGLLKK